MYGKILKSLRHKNNYTQKYVAEKIGVKNNTLSSYESGKRQPDFDTLKKLAELYEVTTDYILIGSSQKLHNIYPVGELTTIPVVGSIKAGPNGLALKEHLGDENIETSSLLGGTYFFLRVTGDSMINAGIYEGDLALIREQDDVENGEIAAVIVNGYEGTLKKVYKLSNGLMLQAANPKYPDRMFSGEELNTVKIVGKLKEIKRKF